MKLFLSKACQTADECAGLCEIGRGYCNKDGMCICDGGKFAEQKFSLGHHSKKRY